jgi:hypothetical protein
VTRAASSTRKLDLDPATVRRARTLARRAGRPIVALAHAHTTVSVERAVLRMDGVSGADPDGIPWVNRLVDAVAADLGLGYGVAVPVWHAMAREGIEDVTLLAQKAAAGSVHFGLPTGAAATAARRSSKRAVGAGIKQIDEDARAPRTDNIGLEKTKIKPERGFIKTNEWMQTSEWRPTGSHGRPQRVWCLKASVAA